MCRQSLAMMREFMEQPGCACRKELRGSMSVMDNKFYEELVNIAGKEAVFVNESLARHTSFKIGGPADYFTEPHSVSEIRKIVDLCRAEGIPFAVIGNGSNLLVSDEGYRGVIICIAGRMCTVRTEDSRIYAEAGALLSKIAREALNNSLTGFEFAGGIPGTLGGAVVMNAGAYGGEMSQVIEMVEVLDSNGNILSLGREELKLGYRTSVIPQKDYIVVSAELKLTKADNSENIRSTMKDLLAKRKDRQPLEYPSAGSTFKRPEGHFAGKLIEDAGLKGFSVGGACVSEKHCGFIINKGGATAKDVLGLMEYVKDTVFKKFGVELEPEVKMLGF